MKRLIVPILVLALLLPELATAYYSFPSAVVAVGQPDFTSSGVNQGGTVNGQGLRSPAQTLIVGNKLLIADAQNNRVLIYNSIPTANNAIADVVIGQTDMSGGTENQSGIDGTTVAPTARTLDRPSGLASDGTKLFVLDRDNHRVLIYNTIPTANNAAANVVIGHSLMTENDYCGESGVSTTGLDANCFSSGPAGMSYDAASGKLIVADTDNDRVLIFNSIPTSNGASANVVVGQADFTHNSANQGGSVDANTLNLSTGSIVGTYSGRLLIADRVNNRVLIYNTIPTANNASANVVVGQADFTHNSANQGGAPSASTFDNPRGAQVDDSGHLFVPDANNARVLVFNSIPTSNGASADVVVGQPDFTTITPDTTVAKLQTFPYHVSFYTDHFIVTDGTSNRVLIFTNDSPAVAAPHRMRNDRNMPVPSPAYVAGTTAAPFADSENLISGRTGADVKLLQMILNLDPDTELAKQGPGSPGNETSFFGAATRNALIKFQEKYASEILAPWKFTKGTGIAGPTTMAKLNTLLSQFLSRPPACTSKSSVC